MFKNSELTESEAKIQADSYTWFHNTYPHLRGLLYHVPNGEKREPIVAKKLQAMGVVPGVPDMPFHYRGKTHFFEFKKPKTGKASDAQKKVHKALEDQDFLIWMPESVEEFQKVIKNIIEIKNPLFTNGVTKEDYYYRHKIFDYLYNLGDAELVLINDICEEDTQQRFINIISEFMNENYDSLSKFSILFTPDFKAFYKKLDGSDREIIYKGSSIVQNY